MRGFFGGDERAGEAVGERTAAADLDAESDRQVDRHAADPGRVAEQGVERLEMIAERLLRLLEPGEDAAVALVENAVAASRPSAATTICSIKLALAVRRQGRDDFLVVEDARGDERLLAAVAVGAQRVEVGQAGIGLTRPRCTIPPPAEDDADDVSSTNRRA